MKEKSEVIQLLHEKVCDIEFEKVNGELRKMKATLLEVLLPEKVPAHEELAKRASNPNSLAVWDVEKEDWRSFRWDRLKSVDGVEFTFGTE